jgi:branched-chain amino acid transport system substrate-binding protein
MTFRPQDHQALQSMYGFKLADQPNVAWAVPVLTHEFTADEMHLPIRNGK